MSNLFSNYFGGGSTTETSRFVGQVVDLGDGNKLKIKKVIAEGGYGYVFTAQDVKTGQDYALKRQVVSRENVKIIKKEIAFLKQLINHPHIIQYVASAGCPPSQTSHGNAEFLIQTELCTGGPLEAVLKGTVLTPQQVLRVFYATCSAVAAMHAQSPPIIHRDIKVENLLLTGEGVVKLCDFGSATTQQVNPEPSWTATQRGLAEDEINRNTTPNYRSPEMINLYSNHPINQKADIWALGCLLYTLCFRTHPFEDAAKLRIINGNYKIPPEDTTYTLFHDIIKSCLLVDPSRRPSVDEVTAQLFSVADKLTEDMEKPCSDLLVQSGQSAKAEPSSTADAPRSTWQSTSHQAQRFFGFMKEGAGSLLKNIKDSSSKIIESMSSSHKRSLNVSYITSRILVMARPHEDQLDELRGFLEDKHPSGYLVFNLSGHRYDFSKLGNQVHDYAWPTRGTPELEKLVDLCRTMDAWLRADNQNVIVIHCNDGLLVTSIMVSCYLLFLGLVNNPAVALKLFWKKRNSGTPRLGSPSQMRYLQHVVQLVDRDFPYKPHPHKLQINMIRLSTVPLFNAIRTGCKPFVEVFQDGERVYTSATHESLDKIRSYHSDDDGVALSLGVGVRGNITVIVHHVRAIPVARKAGMGMTAVRMFQFQLHTGFLDPYTTSFIMERHDIDGSSIKKAEKFPSPFRVTLEVEWERDSDNSYHGATWQNLPYPKTTPTVCFSSRSEEQEVLKLIVDTDNEKTVSPRPSQPHSSRSQPETLPPSEESTSAGSGNLLQLHGDSTSLPENPAIAHQQLHEGGDFFSQLNWQRQEPEMAGYSAFQDQTEESDSDSSSSDSSSDDNFSGNFKPTAKSGTEELVANFGALDTDHNVVHNVTTSQPRPPKEEQLVDLLSDQPNTSSNKPPSSQAGPFDPWSSKQFSEFSGKSDLEISDLLGLEDSDNHSRVSDVQSEVKAAGAEQFSNRIEKMGQEKKGNSVPDQFDPFGFQLQPGNSSSQSANGADLDLLMGSSLQPSQIPHPSHPTGPSVEFDPFDPLGPIPTFNQPQSGKMTHNLSTPLNFSASMSSGSSFRLTNPPTSSQVSGSSFSHSQPNLQVLSGGLGQQKTTFGSGSHGSLSHNTSPLSSSPRTSPISFGVHSGSTGNIPHKVQDPFAQFNLQQMTGNKPATIGHKSPTHPAASYNTQRPTHPAYTPYYMQQNSPSHTQSQNQDQTVNGVGRSSIPPRSDSRSPTTQKSAGGQQRVSSSRPNYNPAQPTKTGVPNKLKKNAFDDLLGPGFNPAGSGEPKTLSELKNSKNVVLDPDKAKVSAWADRKERNIRALLSSLHEILWEGETRWTPVGMHKLVQADQVKKFYRKACLSVHPDKAQDTDHENLARAIFDELNDAYERFEESGSQALF